MRVSIVIPVYNASVYLRETLESIINQTYKDLEIICVDDGSTDNSLQILESFQQNDSRIRILTQKNQYAGAARNAGLSEATGEYIMFLDSDDIFEKNMVRYLVRKAKKYNPDIIVFGYWRFSDNKRKRQPVRNLYQNRLNVSAIEIKDTLYQKCRTMPWDKFIRLDFVRQTGFQYKQTRVNNDIYFNQMIVSEAQRIYFSKKRFVNYRVDNQRSLQGNLNKYPTEFVSAFSDVKTELINRGNYNRFRSSFSKRIIDDIVTHLQRIQSYEEFKMIVESLAKSNLIENSDDFVNSEYAETLEYIKKCNVNESLASIFKNSLLNMVNRNSAAYQIGNCILKQLRLSNR